MRRALLLCLLALVCAGCGDSTPRVVIYCSVDQDFAEAVLARFEEQTGIAVAAVYDVEAAKTVGLYQRLLAEREAPQADVFWNGEFTHTLALARQGLLQPYRPAHAADLPSRYLAADSSWTAVSARARVIVYNTELLTAEQAPQTLDALLEPQWQGRLCIADPVFGTTATHLAALWALRGPARAQELWQGLRHNQVRVLPSNGAVRDAVARGDVPVGLTDTDDVFVGLADGKPLGWVYPDADGEGTLIVPGTVALLRASPQPELGRKLVDFLCSAETERLLATLRANQMPLRPEVEVPAPAVPLTSIRAYELRLEQIAACLDSSAVWLRSRRGLE